MNNKNLMLFKALRFYDIDTHYIKTNEIGNSTNLIYEIESKLGNFILRISENIFESWIQYEAEGEYLNYLYKNNISVSGIIPSKNNKLIEVIKSNEKYYFISLFTKADGHHPQVNNTKEWNENLFYNWGKVMGKIHFVTKNYQPKNNEIKRKQWNEDIYFDEEYDFSKSDYELNNTWSKIIYEINKLQKDKDSYGIIHNDFHQYNFFVSKDNITVFDFDDCLYSWYICDIAIAIYHSLQTVSKTDIEKYKSFEIEFIENFLKGYLSENYISDEWIKKIPLFLEYRRICSYKFFMKLCKNIELSEDKKEYLNNMRCDIVGRVPYCNIQFDKYINRN